MKKVVKKDPGSRNQVIVLLKNTGIEIGLLLLSALLFALSFPSFLSKDGLLFPLAFIAIVPVFIVVHRAGWVRVFLYGVLYGFTCYLFYNYWLATFHPVALNVVTLLYATWFFFLFPVLKAIDSFFPKYSYLLQAFAWVSYEYLRTQGYLGYSYGIIGYSQYLFLPLARLAAVTGVWGVSLMVIFPSALIGNGLKNGPGGVIKSFLKYVKTHKPVIVTYGVIFLLVLVYGMVDVVPLQGVKTWRTALIQQNNDPWKNNYVEYENTLDTLISLSNKALEENPDIVVWSETAFVPAIYYHNRYRESREALSVVLKLLDFLQQQKVPFVVGNDDGRKRQVYLPLENNGKESEILVPREIRVDYNAAILFQDGEIQEIYRKVHLVPFTEHFPYKKIFPWMYKILIEADTHFWEKGSEYTVFEVDGIHFSTPICFEDTFGYLCRRFVHNGADVLVNMTNDTWSGSVVSEIQHMSIAVFRAIENKRSLVRSTNSGITCLITPNGRITERLDPFVEDYLIVDVPVFTGRTTLYTLWEDWFGIGALLITFAGILFGIIKKTLKEKFKKD